MNQVYYSTVIDYPADLVWSVIRDFNSYPVWVEGINESHIEDGKAGDAVGAIRNFSNGGSRIRQRLLAHSDLDRSYTFESCEPLGAITYYRGTGRVTPIIDGNRAFVEWSTVFDCRDAERETCIAFFAEGTPQWLKSLRATLERMTNDQPPNGRGRIGDYIELIPRPPPLPTDMSGWLETFGEPYFRRLPESDRAAARDEVVALRPVLCDEQGRWTADYMRLQFAARAR